MENSLSIIMPCYNEESTVAFCIDEAAHMLHEHGISGEILLVDNGSTDDSANIARSHGAVILTEQEKGYGAAIRCGLAAAKGEVIVIGDCDTTYSFAEAFGMYEMLTEGGYDMVIGNRFEGSMEQGAMSLSHRVGVRCLSALARRRFHTDVYDWHCGLRAIRRDALEKTKLHTRGMEFATEMIAAGARNNLKTGQISVSLKKCRAKRRSKLRTIRDGLRHLMFILFS
ncbi:MAG: glycosyltransferase family 2 protein [Lachnospiraceae bacterium]|nr:glycosyltransferase family 2 protein [Lachnospiraceae bacterium]